MLNFKQFLSETISPTDAVYGLMGWLTTRSKPLTLGSTSDCSEPAQLLDKWVKHNKLPEISKEYPNTFSHPVEESTVQLDKNLSKNDAWKTAMKKPGKDFRGMKYNSKTGKAKLV